MKNLTQSPIAPRFMRPAELAEFFGVTRRCVYGWQQNRVLPYHKIGGAVLYKTDEVMEAVERTRVRAASEPKRRAGRIADQIHTTQEAR